MCGLGMGQLVCSYPKFNISVLIREGHVTQEVATDRYSDRCGH